jgi:hypothetical protein
MVGCPNLEARVSELGQHPSAGRPGVAMTLLIASLQERGDEIRPEDATRLKSVPSNARPLEQYPLRH